METGIVIALITGIGGALSGLAAILSAILSYKKIMVLLEYRMEQVEKKLDSHNGYAKMFSETASEISKMQTDIAVIKTEIEFIRKEAEKS